MPVSQQERKFTAMRTVSRWVDHNREQGRRLTPPYGTVGVGSADFDHLLKATVGEAYLRVLRCGGRPSEAHTAAVKDGDECVELWKTKTKTRAYVTGPYELQRWDRAGEVEADNLHRQFLALLEV